MSEDSPVDAQEEILQLSGWAQKSTIPLSQRSRFSFSASSFLFYIYLPDELELEKVICQLNYEKSKLILGMGKQNSSYLSQGQAGIQVLLSPVESISSITSRCFGK